MSASDLSRERRLVKCLEWQILFRCAKQTLCYRILPQIYILPEGHVCLYYVSDVCLMSLQVPSSLHTDLQTPSSRSPSGSVTSTAASTPSSTHAPTRSLKKLSRVYLEFTVWGRLPDRTTIIRVRCRVTASPSPWASTAGGLLLGSAPPPPWPSQELLPPGTAGNGRSFPEPPRAILDQLKRAERKWPNSAIKAYIGPAAASSGPGRPRGSPAAPTPPPPETFPPLKSISCPYRKKESPYSHCNASSICYE